MESGNIEGNIGKPYLNLYFVAKDKAPERWQQQIIAYHESLCVKKGHDVARSEEQALAKHLGREQEYLAWVKTIERD